MARRGLKSKRNGKSTLIIILLVVMIGGGLSGLYFWERSQLRSETIAAEEDESYEGGPVIVEYKGEDYQQREDQELYLFMGLDKTTDFLADAAAQINYSQADFLFLMVVDHSAKSYYGIHINRDTMAEIREIDNLGITLRTYIGQICLAHAYGSGGKDSCRNELWSVSRYFYDLPIEHYLSITLDGLPVLNDAVGGVVVHVEDDFSQSDPTLVMGQDVHLWGEHALKYVRSRMDVADGTNLNRMKRQREYLNGLYEQFNKAMAKDEKFALRLANDISEYVVSDLTTDELAALSTSLKEYSFGSIYTVEGEAILNEETNHVEFYVDEDVLRDLVIRLFYRPVKN